MEKLETLKQWIEESERIVFFGGAGVSTEMCKLVHHKGEAICGALHLLQMYPPHRFLRLEIARTGAGPLW